MTDIGYARILSCAHIYIYGKELLMNIQLSPVFSGAPTPPPPPTIVTTAARVAAGPAAASTHVY